MGIRIGTEFTGTVNECGGQSIQTKFFIIGLPLFPMDSFFVMGEDGNGIRGFNLGSHPKSVMYGYVRNWLFLPAFLAIIMGFVVESAPAIVFGVLCAVAWVVTTFVLGKGSQEERNRWEVLGGVTGLYTDPEILPPDVAHNILKGLKESWIAVQIDLDGQDPREVLQSGSSPSLAALIYALHCYSSSTEGTDEWQEEGEIARNMLSLSS